MAKNRIPLSDILSEITAEIRKAHEKAAADENPVMKFQECELEFAVDIEGKADGDINIWCIKLGAGKKKTESNTIKVKYSSLGNFVAEITAPPGTLPKPKRQSEKAT